MAHRRAIHIIWRGPFGWPKFEGNLPPVPERPGVYLLTVKYQKGYLLCAPGLTRRSIRIRLSEQTRKYMNGDYHVLNVLAMQRGVRKVIWRGWDWSRGRRTAFSRRKPSILTAARKQLAAYRIFFADVGRNKRLLHRIEAAIIKRLYSLPPPFGGIPDKGMYCAGRRPTERSIFVTNTCPAKLYALPRRLVI
jgi:hypothetical protein